MRRTHLALILASSVLGITAAGQAVNASAAQPAAAQAAAPAVASGDYRLDKSHAKIVWGISHFGFSTYYGEFTRFDAQLKLDAANPAASRLEATIDATSLSTNDAKLDAHLNSADFFDTAKFPQARFVSTAVHRTGAKSAHVLGNLTLHGVTKPVELAVTFNGAGQNVAKVPVAGFSAEGTIKRSDFGINAYLPALGDEVALKISGEFNPAN
ncbi:YceI family protein [Sphingosinicella sp. BN140058]|uniref:YceI family protein n=1 Tax=Sphingosinicella sp. BN140058 TaxID=1892855 RepID=UPI0010138849|nr:YceI family protein [Sphingosinicella sp. BN140058]QAY77571.1 polyisoprenoid-binding protein [Sphingosinicella sp. BN140058]